MHFLNRVYLLVQHSNNLESKTSMNPYLSYKLKILSLFAILLVVYIHAYTFELAPHFGALTQQKSYNSFIQDYISQGVARIAVPLFFSISGYLFFLNFKPSVGGFLKKYQKRFRTLVVPFLLWSLYGILLYFVLQLAPNSELFFKNRLIRNFDLPQFFSTWLKHPIPYQLWFLRDLIFLVLLSPLVWFYVRYLKEAGIALLIVLWVWLFDLDLFQTESLLFFSLGALLSFRSGLLLKQHTSNTTYLVLLAWLLLILLKTWLSHIDFDPALAVRLVHKAAILVGIVAAWMIFDKAFLGREAKESRMLWFASFSFFIYAFHEPVLTIFKKGLFFLLGTTDPVTLLVYLTAPLVVIALSVLAGLILQKLLPWLYALLTGGR
ncbi:acyltransferase family protein [Pontibacter beigongshangensis]|uniref:acyltransferase family protein n=1 Tax=Pontibacter beigongshangensis TaxID=2574733 RepID=UPI0016509234|nr:acyltransferase [Pontibacter beigongshangensis]